MADITMCYGGDCPLRQRCYRYTATMNADGQSFADFTSHVKQVEDGYGFVGYECQEFIPNNGKEQP